MEPASDLNEWRCNFHMSDALLQLQKLIEISAYRLVLASIDLLSCSLASLRSPPNFGARFFP